MNVGDRDSSSDPEAQTYRAQDDVFRVLKASLGLPAREREKWAQDDGHLLPQMLYWMC